MHLHGAQHSPGKGKAPPKKVPEAPKSGSKRRLSRNLQKGASKKKKSSRAKKENKSPELTDGVGRQKAAATIQAVDAASGGKNDRVAAPDARIFWGVTMRPSGKWQTQLYFAGKSRYIGVFDTREKAALAYEIAREKLKSENSNAEEGGRLSPKATEAVIASARKAAFKGVNELGPLPAANYHRPGVLRHHLHPYYRHHLPHHYPPPRSHLPLYGAQHPPGKGGTAKENTKKRQNKEVINRYRRILKREF